MAPVYPKRDLYMGIDPGKSGGISILDVEGVVVFLSKMPSTERDLSDIFEEYGSRIKLAALEKVHSMPKQGVKSTFTFGQHYGMLRGMLISHKIPFEDVRPLDWQSAMQCKSGGDKNVTKAKAQQLFPDHKVIHSTADALLISEYCRRKFGINKETSKKENSKKENSKKENSKKENPKGDGNG